MANSKKYSKEFLQNSGKGRTKGTKNKATIARNEGYQTGYWQAIEDLTNGINPRSEIKSKDNRNGTFGGSDGLQNILTGTIQPTLLAGTGIVAAIFGLWTAEENINNFPPILHTLLGLVDGLKQYVENTEEVIDVAQQKIIETQNEVFNLKTNCDFPTYTEWLKTQPLYIKVGGFSYALGIYSAQRIKQCGGE